MACPNQQEIQICCSNQQQRREWLISMMNIDEGSSDVIEISYPKMEKVPKMLRESLAPDRQCYEPLVVSIGPYHHGKAELELFEQVHKVHFARRYVSRCKDKSKTAIYNEVAEVACEARKYYEEGSTDKYDEATFTQMMFLDGCFVLQFAYECGKDEEKQPTEMEKHMKSHEIAFAQRDLLLLENQLPFKVLQKLMSLRFDNDTEGLGMIETFISKLRAEPPVPSVWENVEKFISEYITDRKCKKLVHGPKRDYPHPPPHLLELWRRKLVNPEAFKRIASNNSNNSWYSYRSVQELKLSGIHFRPNKNKGHRCFTDARYEDQKLRAILRLPPMTIDDSTESWLINLVAHEMCPNGPSDLGVTSYVWFLDTLIDTAEDVKELRKKGILLNYLGSDQLVADLFNRIAKNLVSNPQAFTDLKEKIEKHYKNRGRVWTTEWFNQHFTSPWSFLAFLGAIVSIFFSFIQAYKAVYPS